MSKKPRYLDAYDDKGEPQGTASKSWYCISVPEDSMTVLSKFLADGFEPYAVVFVPGAGAVHYLRIFR